MNNQVDSYVDSDFAGTFSSEDVQDPVLVPAL